MVSFGDSKHKPVKPLQCLLDVTPSILALSAKCTIHDVVRSVFFAPVCLSVSIGLKALCNRRNEDCNVLEIALANPKSLHIRVQQHFDF
jgi:hypothetical protein